MTIKKLLNILNKKFYKSFMIENCKICGNYPDFAEAYYYIDKNQEVQLDINFYCGDCLANFNTRNKKIK